MSGTAIAAPGDSLTVTSQAARLEGGFTADGPATLAWFRPDDGGGVNNVERFAVDAPALDVIEYEIVARTYVATAGVPVVDAQPSAPATTTSHDEAEVRVVGSHPEAYILFAAEGDTAGSVVFDGPYDLYPSAAAASDWDGASTAQYELRDDETNAFYLLPEEHMLLTGGGWRFDAAGPMRLLLFGFEITVRDADGMTTYGGYPTEHDEGVAGFLDVRAAAWTVVVLDVPRDGRIGIDWTGSTDLFARTLTIRGEGHVRMDDVEGLLPASNDAGDGPEGDDPATLSGPLDVTASHARGDAGGAIEWTIPVPGGAAPAAVGPSPGGSASIVWFAVALVAFVGLGSAATSFVLRAAGRDAPPVPGRPADIARAGRAASADEALALLLEGRGAEAVPRLERSVRREPKNPDLRYALGVALGQSGRLAEALSHLEYAMRRDSAYLGMLVSDPKTEAFRHEPVVARLVRRAARRFRDEANKGYV